MLKNYLLNPDFLLNVLYLSVFLFILYKVLGETVWGNIKKKLTPWDQGTEKDFDLLIKRKMDMLRANSGMYVPDSESPSISLINKARNKSTQSSQQIPTQFKQIFEDLNWGTGDEIKKILKNFQREFNYSPNEKNIRELLKNFIKEYSINNAINTSTKEEILTLLYSRTLLNYFLNEISENRFNLIKKISSRLNSPAELFAFSLQFTMLNNQEISKTLYSQRFSSHLIWQKLAPSEQEQVTELFLMKNSLLLCKGANSLIDIIRNNFIIADFIRPWNEISKENELEDSLLVLRAHHSFTFEDIKKNYKKIVQEKHPDKISALLLPKEIESKALKQFQIIQHAMSVIQKEKGK